MDFFPQAAEKIEVRATIEREEGPTSMKGAEDEPTSSTDEVERKLMAVVGSVV